MDFSLTDTQRDLLAQLDKFCRKNLKETEICSWMEEGSMPDSFMLRYVNEDFGRVGLPTQLNGTPTTNLTRVLILERLALHAGATLPIQSLMTYTHLILDVASDAHVALLRSITETTGKLPFSLAISEPQTGSDAFDIRTIAVENEEGFSITGAKTFVSMGQFAPYVALIARDTALEETEGEPSLTFFLVPRDSAGLDTFPMSKMGQHLVPIADIVLDEVQVPKDAVMGTRGHGAKDLLQSFEFSRLFVCATTIGLAQAAFDEAATYALNRTVADSSILSFQQIQELLVDMQVKIDAMRALLYKTACDLDSRETDTRLSTALLKRFVPKTAMEVADSAVQILGGLGYLSTSRAARIWQECRGNRIIMGTDEVMTVIASKRIAQRVAEEAANPPSWRF